MVLQIRICDKLHQNLMLDFISRIQLLQIAQDPHLTVTLTVVGGACMAVAATIYTLSGSFC